MSKAGEFLSDFSNNLFGAVAGASALSRMPTDIGFIPNGTNGETIQIKGDNAQWLGLHIPIQQKKAYESCAPLASVVDRLAESDITGNLEILRATGKGKENFATNEWSNQMRRLLMNPNPMQTGEQFRGQQIVYKKIFGFCPVLPIVPAGFAPEFATSLINLPPWLFSVRPAANSNIFKSKTIEDIIDKYIVTLLNQTVQIDPANIFILEDAFTYDYERTGLLLPQSRLVGLDMDISNVCYSKEADNVLLRKKGPLGFISHEVAAGKDSVGYMPMTEQDKVEIQKELRNYGLSWAQYQYVVSKVAIKWNPMSFDIKQLGTKETVLAGARAICQRFGFPFVLFEDSDATYSNQESAHKKFYDNNVIPNNKRDIAKYNKFFKAEENNCKIVVDYSHLAIFQEDELNSGKARQAKDEGLQIEYLNDIITKNQWLEEIGLDSIGTEGDLLYSQSAAKKAADAQAAAAVTAKATALENNPPVIA